MQWICGLNVEWNSQLSISFRYSEVLALLFSAALCSLQVLKLFSFAGSRILLFYIELSSAEFR